MRTIITLLLLVALSAGAQQTVQIGNQEWMAENLNVGVMLPQSQQQANNGTIEKWCYGNLESNCTKFGGWYQWNELMQYVGTPGSKGLCPDGFHVPVMSEWMELIEYCGGMDAAGTALNENNVAYWQYYRWRPSNSSGFGARGSGYMANNKAALQYKAGYYWTSSILPYGMVPGYETYADLGGQHQVVITTNNWGPEVKPMMRYPQDAYPVRCIKNAQP